MAIALWQFGNIIVPMSIRENFKSEVEAFLKDNEMQPSIFGLAAVNDPSFVIRLRNNRNFRLDTIERVQKYMRDYREKAA